ncbi:MULTISPECIES: hypothetical protein [unclassified Pseudoalteromonas]|uniref:hypothetical protein n=1 Tax=unclassified Pseudoalteromonas TaxID=194690 RepID=UPI002097D79C|nr:hypothetical protein [Pseudoalteromonas sp. XMcav2-N]MCO7187447.1 hypothetical protein [Pseudoalteromonas sp. XMcav2-N]
MKNAILTNASNNESRWLFDSVDQLIYRYGTLEQQNGRLSEAPCLKWVIRYARAE